MNAAKHESIQLDHLYPKSPPVMVWKALTEPELIARWWAPGDVRPVVGHKFDLDMGQFGRQSCEVVEVQPERLLRYKFATGKLDTVITWRLSPEGSGTRLQLTHEGFDVTSPLGRQAFEGMRPGWPNVLKKLQSVLEA